jgi:hypothetical protein
MTIGSFFGNRSTTKGAPIFDAPVTGNCEATFSVAADGEAYTAHRAKKQKLRCDIWPAKSAIQG